jgi:hypothetical protein
LPVKKPSVIEVQPEVVEISIHRWLSLGLHCRDYKGVDGPSRLCLKRIILIKGSIIDEKWQILHILGIFTIGFDLVVKTFFLYII